MLWDLYLAWPWIVTAAAVAVNVVASAHAVLHKRDPRAAIGWVGLVWLVPFVGALLYLSFGINRLQRRAQRLRRRRPVIEIVPWPDLAKALARAPLPDADHLHTLARLVGELTDKPLEPGNCVEPLHNGEVSYPAMLRAIEEAQHSVTLSTYIFDNDAVGRKFIDAMGRAVARGVEVRVLIDDVGIHYSWPTVSRPLRRAGVRVAPFLPKLLPWYSPYANLCLHRKILVADGRIGFTGGMNIRAGHDLSAGTRHQVRDLHFRVLGPVVAQLQGAFASDWHFSTGEHLSGDRWFPKLEACGPVLARGINSGPDDDLEKLRKAYMGALSCSRSHVRIVTPYFLPDTALIAALSIASLRGIEVDIALPAKNNLRMVQWASTAQLGQVLEHGCRVWLTPPPFNHTKLMLVDGVWTLLGSANWDPRSLRLNFEFDLECYDPALAAVLEAHVQKMLERAVPVTMADLEARSLPVKLRDGLAWLLTPYL